MEEESRNESKEGECRPGVPAVNISKYGWIYPLSGKIISSMTSSTWGKEALLLTPLMGWRAAGLGTPLPAKVEFLGTQTKISVWEHKGLGG